MAPTSTHPESISPVHPRREALAALTTAGWRKALTAALDSVAFPELRPGLTVAHELQLDEDLWDSLLAPVAEVLDRAVSINAYRSTGGSFAPHIDRHDALIVQIEGLRRWWLHPPTPAGLTPPHPDRWTLLSAGTTCWLPAGWWHEAPALEGSSSLHLTVTYR